MKTKAVLLFLALLVGGGGATAQTTKNLIVCVTDGPTGFDVAQYTNVMDLNPLGPIFDHLIAFKRGATTLEPALATSWSISKDGLTYTFHLRKGVKFHTTSYFKPTRDFNADDVVFTFSRMMNPRHLFRLMYPAEFPLFSDLGLDQNIAKVFKVDPYTVKFILRKSDATFLSNMATSFASIHCFEYAQQLYKARKASNINFQPIGTGPFIFKRHVRNQKVRYVANNQYWDKRSAHQPKIDELTFSVVKEVAVQAKKLKIGECHLASIPFTQIEEFRKDPNFTTSQAKPTMTLFYLAYNTQKPILSNKLVRQALDMALDKQAILEVAKGLAVRITNFLPISQWGYEKSIKDRPYNPNAARQLLKKAGYAKGFELKFFIAMGSSPANVLIAQIAQRDWNKIGVKVNLISYESGEFFKRLEAGEHDVVFMGGVGTIGDPDDFLGGLACGQQQFSRWCHTKASELLNRARYSTSKAERIKFYQQVQKIIKEEVPLTPLTNSIAAIIAPKYVKGVEFYMLAPRHYTGISVKK